MRMYGSYKSVMCLMPSSGKGGAPPYKLGNIRALHFVTILSHLSYCLDGHKHCSVTEQVA
jgi:hypothetical protein